mmetsp:Transcript_26583/g.73097  ORF Transcript_26583/g.73097 Transcript_26583/m.73097 type:complete len:187 (+) Transcript_26583:3148-3708(+)
MTPWSERADRYFSRVMVDASISLSQGICTVRLLWREEEMQNEASKQLLPIGNFERSDDFETSPLFVLCVQCRSFVLWASVIYRSRIGCWIDPMLKDRSSISTLSTAVRYFVSSSCKYEGRSTSSNGSPIHQYRERKCTVHTGTNICNLMHYGTGTWQTKAQFVSSIVSWRHCPKSADMRLFMFAQS